MDLEIVKVAEASVTTLVKSIDRVIINPIIFFMFAVAMVYFLAGVVQYLASPGNEEVRKKSKSHMIWGVIGLFIMVGVFGIMRLLLGTFGENKIQINNNGDFAVSDTTLEDKDVADNTKTGQEIFPNSNSIDLRAPTDEDITTNPKEKPSSYTTSPFTKNYLPSRFCWRAELYSSESTEYKALQSIKVIARTAYLHDNNLDEATADKSLPIPYGVLSAYDPSAKTYYVWWDARAPINGGKDSDCNLKEIP